MLSYINDFPMEFRDYIASEIIPQYADFDKAHRVDHVLKVIAESLKLSQYYDVNRMMVYVIASYHDLGLCEGREFHHLISGKILWADKKLRKWFPVNPEKPYVPLNKNDAFQKVQKRRVQKKR